MKLARIAALGLVMLGAQYGTSLPAAATDVPPGDCMALDGTAIQTVISAMHGSKLDPAKVADIMSDHVVFATPMMGVLNGKAAVAAAYEELAGSFSDLSLEPAEVLVDDPYLVVRYTMSGTHTGQFKDMEATGKDFAASATTVYRMHCGMVEEAWLQFDQLGLMAQLDEDYAAYMPAEPVPTRVMTESCPAPSREDMETMVRQMYSQAWTVNPDLASVIDPDVVNHAALGPDIVGIDAMESLRKKYFEAFPDLTYRHGEIIVDGDLAVAMWTATGTDMGGFLGMEPTGKTMILDGISIYRGHCGKIVEFWTDSDLNAVREQLSGE